MAAIWTKWRDTNFLSDNWQGKRHLTIMGNCMYNNVAAILNSDMAAIRQQLPHSKHFPRYNESLYSFQSATGGEIQSNVKHMAAILKYNMAAPWRQFWHCQNVPRHRKHRHGHLNFGAIEQEIWAKLWSLWRHIGNQYGGHQGSRIFGVYFFKWFICTLEHLGKVSCFLQKLHDSGDKSTLAAPMLRYNSFVPSS